jgi:exonuclease VII small subunit
MTGMGDAINADYMNFEQVVQELESEQSRIGKAIDALERKRNARTGAS